MSNFYNIDKHPVSQSDCEAAQRHQLPLDVFGVLSCARQGFSGNAAWPVFQPEGCAFVPPGQMPNNMLLVPVSNPINMAAITPKNGEIVPSSPEVPECAEVNGWIANNKLMALGLLAGLWFLVGKGKV